MVELWANRAGSFPVVCVRVCVCQSSGSDDDSGGSPGADPPLPQTLSQSQGPSLGPGLGLRLGLGLGAASGLGLVVAPPGCQGLLLRASMTPHSKRVRGSAYCCRLPSLHHHPAPPACHAHRCSV